MVHGRLAVVASAQASLIPPRSTQPASRAPRSVGMRRQCLADMFSFVPWNRYGAGAGSASSARHPRAMQTPLMRCSYFIFSPEPHVVWARNAGSSGSQRVPFIRQMQVSVPSFSVFGQTAAGAGAREGFAKHAALGPVQRVGDAGAAGGAPSAADTPQMQVFTRKRRAPASDPHSLAPAATAAASLDRSLWGVGGSGEGSKRWRERRRRRAGARANGPC